MSSNCKSEMFALLSPNPENLLQTSMFDQGCPWEYRTLDRKAALNLCYISFERHIHEVVSPC